MVFPAPPPKGETAEEFYVVYFKDVFMNINEKVGIFIFYQNHGEPYLPFR